MKGGIDGNWCIRVVVNASDITSVATAIVSSNLWAQAQNIQAQSHNASLFPQVGLYAMLVEV